MRAKTVSVVEGNIRMSYIRNDVGKQTSYIILDEIFVWGIITAPMTALRIYKFGPGETLLIIWMMAVFAGYNPSTRYSQFSLPISELGRYQIANIVMMMIGLCIDLVLYHPTLVYRPMITDVFSHLFMFFVSSCMFLYLEERSLEDVHQIIRRIVVRGAIVYELILIHALYIDERLFGVRLWLGGKGYRFIGLALNPHQIGMITGTGICLALYLMSITDGVWHKITYIAIACIWFRVSLSLKSDTMTVTYMIITALFLVIKLPKISEDSVIRGRNFIAIAIIGCICLLFFMPFLWDKLSTFVKEAGNGLGRLELWDSGLRQFQDKPICLFTGLGPGANTGMYMVVSGNQMEAHNTYVQQILNSGIFICMYYIIMLIKLIARPLEKNTYLVLSIVYFFLYGFGGNMNRRVLVWFTYTMALLLFEKTRDSEISKK